MKRRPTARLHEQVNGNMPGLYVPHDSVGGTLLSTPTAALLLHLAAFFQTGAWGGIFARAPFRGDTGLFLPRASRPPLLRC